jgi:mono/diheme cytochrome c family protein
MPLAAAVALTLNLSGPAGAQATKPATEEPAPKFDAAYLNSAANIKIGEGVWAAQCRHCHGNSAYPGKAPKLSPGGMEPDFIFDRVTNGFRKMPAWKDVFSLEERKGIVAYIKSDSFSP